MFPLRLSLLALLCAGDTGIPVTGGGFGTLASKNLQQRFVKTWGFSVKYCVVVVFYCFFFFKVKEVINHKVTEKSSAAICFILMWQADIPSLASSALPMDKRIWLSRDYLKVECNVPVAPTY